MQQRGGGGGQRALRSEAAGRDGRGRRLGPFAREGAHSGSKGKLTDWKKEKTKSVSGVVWRSLLDLSREKSLMLPRVERLEHEVELWQRFAWEIDAAKGLSRKNEDND